jgi:hypothetical protein
MMMRRCLPEILSRLGMLRILQDWLFKGANRAEIQILCNSASLISFIRSGFGCTTTQFSSPLSLVPDFRFKVFSAQEHAECTNAIRQLSTPLIVAVHHQFPHRACQPCIWRQSHESVRPGKSWKQNSTDQPEPFPAASPWQPHLLSMI